MKTQEERFISMMRRFDNDPDIMKAVAALYLNDYGSYVQRLDKAIATGDLLELQTAAHYLKGAAGNFSTELLNPIAAKIEACARAGDLTNIASLFEQLLIDARLLEEDIRALVALKDNV